MPLFLRTVSERPAQIKSQIIAHQITKESFALQQKLGRPNSAKIKAQIIRRAADKMEKLNSGQPEAHLKEYFDADIGNLRYAQRFFEWGCRSTAAEDIYFALAGEHAPAHLPQKLTEKTDPTGNMIGALNILFGADPKWTDFVFGIFPIETSVKLLPFRLAKGGRRGQASYFPKSQISIAHWEKNPSGGPVKWTEGVIEPGRRIEVEEMCINTAHEAEHLLFGRFLSHIFHLPVFIVASSPFCVDIRDGIKNIRSAGPTLKSIRVKPRMLRAKYKKGFKVEGFMFFNELRANLRGADIAVKILQHYFDRASNDGWRSLTVHEQNYLRLFGPEKAEAKINICEELLSLAPLFYPTDLGASYLDAEQNFLELVRANLERIDELRRTVVRDMRRKDEKEHPEDYSDEALQKIFKP